MQGKHALSAIFSGHEVERATVRIPVFLEQKGLEGGAPVGENGLGEPYVHFDPLGRRLPAGGFCRPRRNLGQRLPGLPLDPGLLDPRGLCRRPLRTLGREEMLPNQEYGEAEDNGQKKAMLLGHFSLSVKPFALSDGVVAPGIEGLAAEKAPENEPQRLVQGVPLQALPGVLGTARLKPAAGREKRRNTPLIEARQENQKGPNFSPCSPKTADFEGDAR